MYLRVSANCGREMPTNMSMCNECAEKEEVRVSDLFELSFRWQDGAVQVIIYALVIYLGLVIISKITDKREREGKK
jgi:hypothetical protein